MSATETTNVLSGKLERLKAANQEWADREKAAAILADAESTSVAELAALEVLRNVYGATLLELTHCELSALHRSGQYGIDYCVEADEILKSIHASEAHHKKLQQLAIDAQGGRKVGSLEEIRAVVESGKGMAARLEQRINTLAQ